MKWYNWAGLVGFILVIMALGPVGLLYVAIGACIGLILSR